MGQPEKVWPLFKRTPPDDPRVRSYLIHRFGLQKYADARIEHCPFGAVKPAAQTYLGCVAQLGAQPQETLFIDDSEANVTGALDAGLQACHFVETESLASDLARLGLIDA